MNHMRFWHIDRDAFGEPKMPEEAPGLEVIPLPPADPQRELRSYEDYKRTGGTPIPVLESAFKQVPHWSPRLPWRN
jgi:hypothetical protein